MLALQVALLSVQIELLEFLLHPWGQTVIGDIISPVSKIARAPVLVLPWSRIGTPLEPE